MKILIATHNPAKQSELQKWLRKAIAGIEVVTLDDLHITDDPEETGKTFAENAKLKAEYYAKKSRLPTIADDGGIEIDALNGEPGVISKRWLGHDATDQELIDYTLLRMKDVSPDKRTARFTVVLCFVEPVSGRQVIKTESIEGTISVRPSQTWQPGFPYRAVFKVSHYNKYYDELTPGEHETVNHRHRAIEKLAESIRNSKELIV